jgi:hypothetical protein
MWVVLDVQPALIGGEMGVARAFAATVHAAAEHNLILLENHPDTQSLRECVENGTIIYQNEKQAGLYETVKSIPLCILNHGGDCAHLSAWRLAECWRDDLRQFGKRLATCKVYWRSRCPRRQCQQVVDDRAHRCGRCGATFSRPKRTFHAEIRRADGEVEDWSRMAGM